LENRDRKDVEVTRELTRDGRNATEDMEATGSTSASADISLLPPGWRIGPYRIVRELGHGGMGLLLEASKRFEAQKAPADQRRQAFAALAELYERWGRDETAARYRKLAAGAGGP